MCCGGVGQSVGVNADNVKVDDARGPTEARSRDGEDSRKTGYIRVLCPVKHDCGCDLKRYGCGEYR